MSRKHHYVKLESEYYQALEKGIKKFEVQRNDRDFKIKDMVKFYEVVNGVETGRNTIRFEIQYVLQGGQFGLDEDYCIFNW